MLKSIDHAVYLCRDIAKTGAELRETIDLTEPDWVAVDGDGIWTAEYRLHGGAIELVAPAHSALDPARTCPGLLAKVDAAGPGFKSIVFAAADLEGAHKSLSVAGLEPEPIIASEARHFESGVRRQWRRFRCPDRHLNGLKIFVIERADVACAREGAPSLCSLELTTCNLALASGLCGQQLGLTGHERSGQGSQTFQAGATELRFHERATPANVTGETDRIEHAVLRRTDGKAVIFGA